MRDQGLADLTIQILDAEKVTIIAGENSCQAEQDIGLFLMLSFLTTQT